MSYLVFDIGGTNTRVARAETLGEIDESVSFKTPADFEAGIAAIGEATEKLLDASPIAAAGGVRGMLSGDKDMIISDVKLTAWLEQPLRTELERRLGSQVWLENDAAMAGLGEAVYGAGKGYEIVAYHTVSTGVGGAKIENGKIDSFSVGFEPGRQVLDIDRTILGEETTPTLENLVSGTAVEMRMGSKPYEIAQDDLLWDQLAFFLGNGLRNTILYWSPDIIILGGSMILGDPKIELERIISHTNEILGAELSCPVIETATLGDASGLYGAMARLAQEF